MDSGYKRNYFSGFLVDGALEGGGIPVGTCRPVLLEAAALELESGGSRGVWLILR